MEGVGDVGRMGSYDVKHDNQQLLRENTNPYHTVLEMHDMEVLSAVRTAKSASIKNTNSEVIKKSALTH